MQTWSVGCETLKERLDDQTSQVVEAEGVSFKYRHYAHGGGAGNGFHGEVDTVSNNKGLG